MHIKLAKRIVKWCVDLTYELYSLEMSDTGDFSAFAMSILIGFLIGLADL